MRSESETRLTLVKQAKIGRVTIRQAQVYWEGSGDRDLSRVKDLSLGGLFIQTPGPKRIGSTTNLHFLVQEGQIRADATVQHVKSGSGLGLKFKTVNEKDSPNLAALLERLQSLS